MPGNGTVGSHGNTRCHSLRNCWTLFQCSCSFFFFFILQTRGCFLSQELTQIILPNLPHKLQRRWTRLSSHLPDEETEAWQGRSTGPGHPACVQDSSQLAGLGPSQQGADGTLEADVRNRGADETPTLRGPSPKPAR